ncbi:site-2 protease family protein [Jiella sp. M17.18]|uniref:site-2 protease family protein n=1 Tax=Jiella sp. M17.18 TaxID=3234247 RepID=UPI0034DEE107
MDVALQVADRLVALCLIVTIQGVAIAAAADALARPGVARHPRRSLNPLSHLDVVGGLCFVVFGYGWGRPVPLDDANARGGRLGRVSAALAGLGAVVLLAVAAELLRRLLLSWTGEGAAMQTIALCETISTLSLAFVLINLIPLPPLTGGHFLAALAPAAEPLSKRYRTVLMTLIAAFVISGMASLVFLPVYRPLARRLLGV